MRSKILVFVVLLLGIGCSGDKVRASDILIDGVTLGMTLEEVQKVHGEIKPAHLCEKCGQLQCDHRMSTITQVPEKFLYEYDLVNVMVDTTQKPPVVVSVSTKGHHFGYEIKGEKFKSNVTNQPGELKPWLGEPAAIGQGAGIWDFKDGTFELTHQSTGGARFLLYVPKPNPKSN